LDEYKTQVLLLHSEQSTLDNLSSGFSDRYTVHCATSGSEALNTLVETPINVIVTAQDLPGMSGLEALREARKRSPETIGILLAGNKTSDVQALVGDEEVFQVVSGTVTGDGLLQLVDNATRQMRLMALAHSANDMTAGVDEPAEHIIMETSENGSTIISDGTGRMPILDPQKVSAAASVGSRSVDVLVLTKDQEFLETIKDSSRGMHKVFYANTLGQANEAISKHKIGVAVVDAAMVGEKIEQLTQHLRKGSSRLVSIVAGRRDDGDMLMDLINRGKVYRFLLKPVSPGRARLAVEASVKHHLEAPDAAFINKGDAPAAAVAAAKPAPQPVAKPAPTQAAPTQAAPKPVAKPAPKPQARPAEQTRNVPADPPLGSSTAAEENSPIEDGLADAFGQDDASFTETVTGLISSVSKRFSSNKGNDPVPEAPTPSIPTPAPASNLDLSAESADDSLLRNPKFMGIAATVVVIVAGALFWFVGGSDSPVGDKPNSVTPSITESDAVIDEAPSLNSAVASGELLDEARLARNAGQIFNPAGSNAIELYASALAADPDNDAITVELETVVAQALGMAESAMLDSKLDDAAAALQRVAAVDAANARLPFLTAQLAQMQLRERLDDARVAVRESRFEDAATALNAARNLGIADISEIDAVAAELATARSEQRADEVLAKAAERLAAGDLLSPANDNARYYYELVLSNDAGNTAARQGLGVIAGKLAFQARAEIDNGDLTLAEDTLANAQALDPANSEVAATVTALASARAAAAAKLRREEAARQAAADERALRERQAAAAAAEREAASKSAAAAAISNGKDDAAEQVASSTDAASVSTFAVEDVEATDSEQSNAGDDDAVESTTIGSTTVESNPVESAPVETAQEPAQVAVSQAPAPISSLNRTKYVAPKYPRSAERRNLSGWVDVVFTVTVDGTVTDVEVRNSEPGDVFINAAVKAVEKWEFEPVVENGRAVEKTAGVRMMFALE
jgi:serine/threonine-protein kinase